MKTLALKFLLGMFITVLLHVPASISVPLSKSSMLSLADASETGTNPGTNPDDERIKQVAEIYERKIKYAIVIIFAVLFVAGVYWWTYGKLHHRIPRY